MNGKNLAAVFGLGLLLASTGCVSCGYDACKPVLDAGPFSEAPIADRRHVYVFLVNGLMPDGSTGLEGLRLKLAERGYEKVYRGELCHAGWMGRELKRVRECDPEARFIVVGYGLGCGSAIGLANDSAGLNIPIDTVVLLDPPEKQATCQRAGQTLVVRSGVAAPEPGEPQGVCILTASHYSLPTHARTVDAIVALLSETSMRVEHPPILEEAAFEFEDAPRRAATRDE